MIYRQIRRCKFTSNCTHVQPFCTLRTELHVARMQAKSFCSLPYHIKDYAGSRRYKDEAISAVQYMKTKVINAVMKE
jgi:hypothetical protein